MLAPIWVVLFLEGHRVDINVTASIAPTGPCRAAASNSGSTN
jgi:hypothetical protein